MAEGKWFPSLKELFQMGSTFSFTMIAWVFFRSETIKDSLSYLVCMITTFTMPNRYSFGLFYIFIILIFDIFLVNNKIEKFYIKSKIFRLVFYFSLINLIFFFSNETENIEFIYFQF